MQKLIYTKSDLFLIFYTLSYFLNETEKWDRPLFALASIGFLIGVLFSRTRNYTFTVFLFFSLIHILSDFPKSSNHFNVMLFVNILLILSFSIRYKLRVKEYTLNSNDFLTLRWFLILVYFFTGFHKLNDDFLFSDWSCANWYHDKLIWFITGDVFRPYPEFIYLLSPFMVVILELIESIGLLFRRTQLISLISFLLFHAYLTLGGFVDFAGVSIAIMISFIPDRYIYFVNDKIKLKRIYFYMNDKIKFIITLFIFTGILWFFEINLRYFTSENKNFLRFVQGILFNILFLYLLYPFILNAIKKKIIVWESESLILRSLRNQFAVLILFLFGFQNYLGLATAGTFSMFSNLETEGGKSNHILLRSNPFEIFPYQKELVEIVQFNPPIYDFSSKFRNLQGKRVPKLVFEEFLRNINRSGLKTFDAHIIFQGRSYKVRNIHRDPRWITSSKPLASYFLNFRPIIENENEKTCMW